MNEQMDDHLPFEGELAAYMLDALDPDEHAEFERHLATCHLCQTQSRWLSGAVDVLPESVSQMEPPSTLRANLLGEVYGGEQELPSPARRPARRRAPRPSLGSFFLRPAAGFAVVVLVVAVAAGYMIGDGNGGDRSTTTVQANATAAEPGAKATIVGDADHAIVTVARLPEQPRGKVYEVWTRKGTKVDPATLFVVAPDGTGQTTVPGGLDGLDEVMVTLEPEGGSAKPTSQPVLRAEV